MEVIVLGCTRKPDLERPRPAVCQEDDYVCVFFMSGGGGKWTGLALKDQGQEVESRMQLLVLRVQEGLQ